MIPVARGSAAKLDFEMRIDSIQSYMIVSERDARTTQVAKDDKIVPESLGRWPDL